MKAGVALGSNLGDRQQHLKRARQAMAEMKGVTSPILASAIYETEPVDCEEGAGAFLNAVVEFDYAGEPSTLLRELRAIESSLGRSAGQARNRSRRIDLDLLYFGDRQMSEGELQLPHPRAHLRRFVLAPLAEIRPDLVLPGQRKSAQELLASLAQSGKVARLTTNWDSA